ncbi:hypothetical protein ACF087_36685 [Streptomyces goshikiensis]|uniref:hypothetical protein n=1 Tax=Streptomyces goshikiensis TaxID=1942 RepID=UPI0036F772B3
MATLYKFVLTHLCTHCYNELIAKIAGDGIELPGDRLAHICYGEPEKLQVIEVWRSPEAFNRYALVRPQITCSHGFMPDGGPELPLKTTAKNVPIHNCIISPDIAHWT